MWSTAKIVSVIILFSISFLSGILSFITVSCLARSFGTSSKFKRVISVLNCVTGGVFFATSILDLLPEAREKMTTLIIRTDFKTKYPFTELLVAVGFFAIVILECVVHRCQRQGHIIENLDLQTLATNNNTTNKTTHTSESSFSYQRLQEDFEPKTQSNFKHNSPNAFEEISIYDDMLHTPQVDLADNLDHVAYKQKSIRYNETLTLKPSESRSYQGFNGDFQNISKTSDKSMSTAAALGSLAVSDESNSPITTMRAIILLIALSVHMMFDGLALGLLNMETRIWQLVMALAIHKALAFFTIGLQIYEIFKSLKKSVVSLFLFALVSPFGAFIGNAIISTNDSLGRDAAAAILQGIATGTFIYVTFFEILQRELGAQGHDDLLNAFAAIFGFALVAVVRVFQRPPE